MIFLATNRLRHDAPEGRLGTLIGEHVRWTTAQLEAGTLVQAGRWGESGGVAIVRAPSAEDAARLLERDPLVAAGVVEVEVHRFYPDRETARFTDAA